MVGVSCSSNIDNIYKQELPKIGNDTIRDISQFETKKRRKYIKLSKYK